MIRDENKLLVCSNQHLHLTKDLKSKEQKPISIKPKLETIIIGVVTRLTVICRLQQQLELNEAHNLRSCIETTKKKENKKVEAYLSTLPIQERKPKELNSIA